MTGTPLPMPAGLVVMGVSGVGKTTTGRLVARRLGWRFAEADDLHPPANIGKMTAGVPLTDADRSPWLGAIRDWLSARGAEGENAVVACSALKRSYRDVLRQASPHLHFVFLRGSAEVIARRMANRSGHFMPLSLLESQLGDLEPLQPDEDGVTIDVTATPEEIVMLVLTHLGIAASPSSIAQP